MGVNQIFERTLFLKCLIYGEFTLPWSCSSPKIEPVPAHSYKDTVAQSHE